MPDGVVIRAARPEDREALIEQFRDLNLYEEPISNDRRTDRAGAEAGLAEAEAKVAEKEGVKLVAEVDGRVVGYLFLIFDRHAVYVREEKRDHAHVTDLFVLEELRGRGIGRALLLEAERVAEARGVDHMTIGVLTGNLPAERAYARFGFRPDWSGLKKPLRRQRP
jgi:GNAT superfamily N-acetyltransferase